MSKTLSYFHQITQYPRPSKQEAKIRNFLISWADQKWLESLVDKTGNLVVYVPSKNSDSRETVILQAHMDMVCVKTPESTHDFLNDPIETYEKDGWLYARGTTLGADNGIGLALAMAAVDFESHPALELVFTIDEEAGMSGIEGLDFSLLSGKKVINLDSEDEDEITISSAGGIGVIATKKLEYTKNTGIQKYTLKITGMQGGHSGVEIHKNRGNAIVALLEFITTCPTIETLYDIKWGVACNVIPSKAEAIVTVADIADFTTQIELFLEDMKKRFDCPGISYALLQNNDQISPILDGKKLAQDIHIIKTGVYAMSQKIPDLVETSMNLGTIKIENGVLEIVYLARSSVNADLYKVFDETKAHFLAQEYEVAHDRGYLGWQDDPDSLLLQVVREETEKVIGKPPKVVAIHAGLECGAMVSGLGEWVNALSIGPNVREVHSVNEHVEIASIEKMERVLEGILGRL